MDTLAGLQERRELVWIIVENFKFLIVIYTGSSPGSTPESEPSACFKVVGWIRRGNNDSKMLNTSIQRLIDSSGIIWRWSPLENFKFNAKTMLRQTTEQIVDILILELEFFGVAVSMRDVRYVDALSMKLQ